MSKSYTNLMPLYEANYRKLAELVPDFDGIDHAIILGKQDDLSLHLQIIERFKYTSTIMLSCCSVAENTHVSDPFLKIRVYHDARVAEVLGFQGHVRIQPFYPYPNPKMYQRDEKRQINRFLGELLDYCLLKGYLVNIESVKTAV